MTVLGINGNAASLAATYQAQQTAARLQNTMTQMSTGYRINSAADDPAGLIASELMRSEITAANKAVTNAQRANGVLSIASLQDYVVAVAGAEASIRDTDYADATSKAARDQILLQTGLRALSITQQQQRSVVNTLLAGM